MSARLVIMRHWKDQLTPSLQEVILTTHTHSTYERMFTWAHNRHQKVNNLWKNWVEWYETPWDYTQPFIHNTLK